MKKFYVILVVGDVEPELSQPYDTEAERDVNALQCRIEHPEDGIYWLDLDEHGTPTTGAYTGAFFMGDI